MAYQDRSLGAYADLHQLASYQLAARFLSLQNNVRAINQIAGPFKSLTRGRGMEFEEVRLYQAGDDIRNIDWRVTARTGKAYTKLFREEREKPVLIITDQRHNMFFGSKCAMKSVLACDIAAYLLWAAHHKGDKIGGIVFNDQEQMLIKPRQQQKTVLQYLHHLTTLNHVLNRHAKGSRYPLQKLLQELRSLAKPGSQIFVISDFYDFDESCKSVLYDISKHCQIMAIKIYDPLEQHLPKNGLYIATNGASNITIDAGNKANHKVYEQQFVQHETALKQLLGNFNIPLIPVSTAESPIAILKKYFGCSS